MSIYKIQLFVMHPGFLGLHDTLLCVSLDKLQLPIAYSLCKHPIIIELHIMVLQEVHLYKHASLILKVASSLFSTVEIALIATCINVKRSVHYKTIIKCLILEFTLIHALGLKQTPSYIYSGQQTVAEGNYYSQVYLMQ